MHSPLKTVCCIVFFLCTQCLSAADTIDANRIEQQANSSITKLYHTLNSMPNASMPERIDWISKHFKNIVYVLGSLGEGATAQYDQFPVYRIDAFDCDTYVNTVLALALAHSLNSFQHCIKLLRYKDGVVSYINRNHFTSIDWNKNNQKRGVLKDITLTIVNRHQQSVAQFAKTLINKPGWYAHKTLSTIRVTQANKAQRLSALKAQGTRLAADTIKIPYLPLDKLFLKSNKPNLYLFAQIPNGAIVEIVRPHWDLRQQIGTFLDVSHLGFAIWIDHTLYFRQASSQYGKVVDVPLISYLDEARSSPTIKGINIQVVVPQTSQTSDCP